ncbi:unnamed protein product [Caenorhabditis auriculariae]|uniref:Ubiquitin-like domain-containing protein n=1 Tax=Caenorhabditis auriculariae TaxID=2777116 RepID=A0A8S1H7B3_9PELO|nr:unnamed protein product [Caenorhabditis auriculariae]
MAFVTLSVKMLNEKTEKTIELPVQSTVKVLHEKVSEIFDLPTTSFKLLNGGKPLKNEETPFKLAGIENGAKLTVMIFSKLQPETLNELEKHVAELAGEDPKKKLLAVLRVRKMIEKRAQKMSLDELRRAFGPETEKRSTDVRLSDDAIEKVVDHNLLWDLESTISPEYLKPLC